MEKSTTTSTIAKNERKGSTKHTRKVKREHNINLHPWIFKMMGENHLKFRKKWNRWQETRGTNYQKRIGLKSSPCAQKCGTTPSIKKSWRRKSLSESKCQRKNSTNYLKEQNQHCSTNNIGLRGLLFRGYLGLEPKRPHFLAESNSPSGNVLNGLSRQKSSLKYLGFN